MSEKELKELNEILGECIEYDDFYIDGFMVLKRINDFLLKYYQEPVIDQTYIHRVDINTSYKLAYDFLYTINPNYASYLKETWEDGRFIISDREMIEGIMVQNATSIFYEKTNSRKILMHEHNNIVDAFSIVHELVHDVYLKDMEEGNETFHFFCEAIAFTSEFLFEDYLREKGLFLSDIGKNKKQMFSAINYKAFQVGFEHFLLSEYYKNSSINNLTIYSYLKGKPKHFKIYAEFVIDGILYTKQIGIDNEARNIIGIAFASYMHQRILDKPLRVNELIYINENFDNMDLQDIFKYLDLKIEDIETDDLTTDSYRKIFKFYKKEIKTLR